jgi:hypothetical protein
MNKPKLEIKNFHSGYSSEWGAGGRYDFDLWINGIKCMKVIEEGNGGCMDYEHFIHSNPKAEQVKANIKLLKDYIKTLPPETSNINDRPFTIEMDMDLLMGEMVEDRKMEKTYAKSICSGMPKGSSYVRTGWKGKSLKDINILTLQHVYNEVKAGLKDGEVILNTNLEALGVIL